jgi:hypothetical protein
VALPLNDIHHGDCVELLKSLEPGSIDLAFADPPFNIGYEYDVYDDRQEAAAYLDWCEKWIAGVYTALKPTGTFWLAIGDEYAAELKVASQKLGFTCRSWVIWYYTFGVNCKSKFSRSHAHLFHFVKDAKSFTFNADKIRVPSARMLVYGDGRANPQGRLPDDTWILRPQDLPQGFQAEEDTWYRCPSSSSAGSSAPAPMKGRPSSIPSPAARRHWQSPKSWDGNSSASTCPRSTSPAAGNASPPSKSGTNSMEPPNPSSAPRAPKTAAA